MKLLDDVKAKANVSPCGIYRYSLTRTWEPAGRRGHVLWVMLNPSTADADTDDPTIRRCQAFARAWCADGIVVANLFALRAKDPNALLWHADPIGPYNDATLRQFADARGICLVVVAWGANRAVGNRGLVVGDLLTRSGRVAYCLGTTRGGQPKHPLYVRGDVLPEVWA